MRLVKLSTRGLKARDIDIELGAVHVIAGHNGEGKSTAQIAVRLLTTGRLSSPDTKTTALDSGVTLPSTGDGVMTLAQNNRLKVEGVWVGDDKTIRIEREWRRSRNGKVTESVEVTGLGNPGMSAKEKKVLIAQTFAPSLDLFFPADLVSLTPSKLRTRLLRATAAELGEVGKWSDPSLPQWAQPAAEAEDPLDWIGAAKIQADKRLAEMRADLRRAEGELEAFEDAWQEPETPEKIQVKLEAIRAEGQQAADLEAAKVRLEEMRAQFRRLGEAVTVDAAQAAVTEAEAKANEAAAARKAYAEHSGQVMRLRQDARSTKDAMLVAHAAAGGEESTTDELDALTEAARAARVASNEAGRTFKEAQALVKTLGGDCALPECPECQADLRPHYADALKAAERMLGLAMKADNEAIDAEAAAYAAHSKAEAGVKYAAARIALDTAETALAGLEERAPSKPDEGAESTLSDARRALKDAEEAAEKLEALEVDIEIAAAELEEMPTGRSRAELAEAYRAAEAELEELGRTNARREAHQEAKDGIEVAAEQVEAIKAVAEKIDGIHQEMLAAAAGIIESRFGAATGAPVTVRLEDERRNPTCRIEVAGNAVSGLSGGEMKMWLAANVMVFAPTARGEWLPLLQDGFESISQDKRAAYLATLAQAQAEGIVSQVLVTGCPDSVPDVEGVTVTVFGGDEDTAQVAA